MPISATVYAESYSFAPTSLLSLYELDSRFISVNGSLMRFHPGVNGVYRPIVFNGITYTPFPIEITDMEIAGSGGLPRPKLRASNINGFISQFLRTQGDLIGARFIRRRVFARFIDGSNWADGVNPYGTPDPTAAYDDEIFYVNRKVSENPDAVELECTSPMELENVQLPNRPMMAVFCSFTYRDGETCGYIGAPVMDRFGKYFTTSVINGGYGYTLSPQGVWNSSTTYQIGDWVTILSENDFSFGQTLVYVCSVANTAGTFNNPQFNPTNWIADACPRSLLGCKGHFPAGTLPFGGFPGTARAPYVN